MDEDLRGRIERPDMATELHRDFPRQPVPVPIQERTQQSRGGGFSVHAVLKTHASPDAVDAVGTGSPGPGDGDVLKSYRNRKVAATSRAGLRASRRGEKDAPFHCPKTGPGGGDRRRSRTGL